MDKESLNNGSILDFNFENHAMNFLHSQKLKEEKLLSDEVLVQTIM